VTFRIFANPSGPHGVYSDVSATAMRDEAVQRAAWPLVVRVAMVCSLLAAALGAALYRFLGVSATPIVVATAIIGLVVGLSLPPARPQLHRLPANHR
jgi:small neutral amino acid transporter SnatA (MarC family)